MKRDVCLSRVRGYLMAGLGSGVFLFNTLLYGQATLRSEAVLTAAQSSDKKAAAESASDGLEEITVTAERRENSLSKVPISISAFDSEQLAERSITTETDLQASVPGLTVRTGENANYLNYAIRGQTLDFSSGSNPAVLVYLNDVQVASPTAGQFYDLQSVQVLKGPQGTLFGRNATGGAVLYTTAQPTDQFGGFFTETGGNFGLYEEQGAVNLPLIPQRVSLRLAFDFKNEEGYVRNIAYGSNLGNIEAAQGRASLLLTPNDSLKSTLVVQTATQNGTELNGEVYSVYPVGGTHNGYPLNSTAAAIYSPGSPFFTPSIAAKFPAGIVAYVTQQQKQGLYVENLDLNPLHRSHSIYAADTTTYNITSDIQFKNIVGFASSRTRSDQSLSGTPFGILDINSPEGGIQTDIHQWSEEAQLLGKAFEGKLTYIAGVYAASNRTHVDFPVEVGADLPTPISQFSYDTINYDDTYAGFFQDTYDLGDLTKLSGLSVTTGIRFTEENISLAQAPDSLYAGSPKQHLAEGHPSWQVGLQDQLSPNLLLYVVSRYSWRNGNYNGSASPADNANRFAAETTVDYEVGAKFSGSILDRETRLDIAVYDQKVHNVQRDIYLEVDGNPASFTHNVPRAEVKGVELDGEIRAAKWLKLGLSGAYTDAVYTEPTVSLFGQTLTFSSYPDTPRWSGSIYGEVYLPVSDTAGTISLRADAYTQTSQYFTSLAASISPGTLLPGYSIVNMRVNWNQIFGSHASLSIFARNILDRGYYLGGYPNGPAVGTNTATPAPPRTFGGQLTYAF
jgi:iron complex outermembrane receptor protein